MKAGVKNVLRVLVGIVLGGSVGSVVTYHFTKKKFLELSDERVRSLEEYIDRLQAERVNRELGYSQSSDADDVDSSVVEKSSGSGSGNNYISRMQLSNDEELRKYQEVKDDGSVYTRYSQISRSSKSGGSKVDERYAQIAAELEHPMDSDEDESAEYRSGDPEYEERYEDANKDGEEWSEKLNSNSPPFIISYDQFGATGYLDEETLYYYAGDDTLINENEQIVPAPEDILGECLEASGFKTNSERELYVRNYRRSTDYKISKVFDRYSDKDIY